MYALECNNLSKKYKNEVVLNNVTIKLEENKIYGLLGRNGAGKTTLLNIVSGQVFNSSGSIKIFGEEHFDNEDVLGKICFVKDKMPSMTNLKVKKILDLGKYFFENWDEDFRKRLIKEFGLDEKKTYNKLSKGMEAMVGIILALASRAPLTIFDESYLGLDAAARKLFYEILLEDYLVNSRTIIFSTHLIDEVSNIFEEIIILHRGELLLQEDMDKISEKSYVITGEADVIGELTNNKNVIKKEELGDYKKAYIYDEISFDDKRLLINKGFDIKPMTLQEFFIDITNDKK
ncbi:ATP-binding cassette domain-containing protein [Clostridium sp. DL1XJH146]